MKQVSNMNHAHNEQLQKAQDTAGWLQSTQNMVGGTITTYLTIMKQIAPQKGDRLIFWLGARTNMVFGMGFDMSVNREGVLQAFVSNTGGTVAQIAAGKVGERLVATQLTRFIAQRVLMSVGAAVLAPEIAMVVGACGVAFMAYQAGNVANGWIDRTFFTEKKEGARQGRAHPPLPPSPQHSHDQIKLPRGELQMLAFWLLIMDTSPYRLPGPLGQKYIGTNRGPNRTRR